MRGAWPCVQPSPKACCRHLGVHATLAAWAALGDALVAMLISTCLLLCTPAGLVHSGLFYPGQGVDEYGDYSCIMGG